MLKTLQRKFIITAMVAITVLILIILGVLNGVNASIVGDEIDETLRIIAESDGDPRNLPVPPAGEPPIYIQSRDDRDRLLGSNFFVVRFGETGLVESTDMSHIRSVEEAEAVEMARAVFDEYDLSEYSGKYRFAVTDRRDGPGKAVIFLDASQDLLVFLRLLGLSVSVGVVCWGLMLLLVIALSNRAIRPIAENMQRQRQFVTDAGHELKTPLAIIHANAEALELYDGESKWTRNIKEQTRRLDGLMKNLLLQARMDEGPTGSVTAFSMSELVSEALRGYAAPVDLGHVTLCTDVDRDVILRADREQVAQLVSILLDNAMKYTGENGQITVRLTGSERETVFSVENTCPSLPDVPPEKLFDRFYRGDAAQTQKTGGFGIGLSVARSICEANGAQIAAAYREPDTVGFTVRFSGRN